MTEPASADFAALLRDLAASGCELRLLRRADGQRGVAIVPSPPAGLLRRARCHADELVAWVSLGGTVQ